jgi:C4-dicarboxylate-specific signal transduction histidine kinase
MIHSTRNIHQRFEMGEAPRPLAFGVAVAATLLSLLVRWLLWPVLGDAVPHMAFFPAVVVSAYVGGLWPGLLATALSAVAANYFLTGQLHDLRITSVNDVSAVILFVLVGTIISGLSESLHRARRRIVEDERQRAEGQMELARVNRVTTMGQLTASIAHEVRQPLAALLTNAQAGLRWLAAQPPALDEVQAVFDNIIVNATRAGEIVDRVSAMVKKAPLRQDRVYLNDIILDIAVLTRSEILRNGISLRHHLAQDLPPVLGDRVQLEQLLVNLIVNAIEAMSAAEQRELQIVASMTGDNEVTLEVRDSGPGVTADRLQHLFDPFYTTKADGMGMGLAICRSIAEAHGGRIIALANEPRGMVFRLTLPARATDLGKSDLAQAG